MNAEENRVDGNMPAHEHPAEGEPETDDVIELVDVVNDQQKDEEVVELTREMEAPIELTEPVELTEPIELTEPVETWHAETQEQPMAEFSEFAGAAVSNEGVQLDEVGLEMPEQPARLQADLKQVEEGISPSAYDEKWPLDTTEVSQLSETMIETGGIRQVEAVESPQAAPGAAPSAFTSAREDEALKSAVLDRFSEDRLETLIRRVVEETIAEKAERVLLEVAETAIAKEIERIKKAL